ncbi:MAG: hypothetical protein HY314_05430, partial [Acidobacteria bacterium]|nr:hypothetical protein [Acidobacteriota bacterium]
SSSGIGVSGSSSGIAVFGSGGSIGVSGSGSSSGVEGASSNVGVRGIGTGVGVGVRAQSDSSNIIEGYGAASNLRFRVHNNGNVTADGTFTGGGADFAELMDLEEPSRPEAESYQPGDVLIISPETGKLKKGQQPYCPLVAGVYSTKPGFLGGPGMDEARPGQVPLAVIGIVPCKVTGENGPIAFGDLLVTSSTPGHAMKGTDRSQMLGAIVGKALEPLPSGTGTIKVLVTLQ